ncbi:MAG: metallophosphoesterase family protein [Acidobacteriota bacterium]
MRRIVHLSDIHFGSVDLAIAERVVEKIVELGPDVVVVSGDLTQRARSAQFIEAKRFLDLLPKPQIVVPGNHDVPLYNVFARFGSPLEKFRRYITEDLTPSYIDAEIAVVGVNTARSLTIKGGRINETQIQQVRDVMCGVDEGVLKVVVTHHPFDLPVGFDESDIVGRAKMAMPLMSGCGADVFLAGHLHVSHIGDTAKRYKLENGRSALVIQAGTATSVRGRGEANSFNLIEFDSPRLTVHRLECSSPTAGFQTADVQAFRQTAAGWERSE